MCSAFSIKILMWCPFQCNTKNAIVSECRKFNVNLFLQLSWNQPQKRKRVVTQIECELFVHGVWSAYRNVDNTNWNQYMCAARNGNRLTVKISRRNTPMANRIQKKTNYIFTLNDFSSENVQFILTCILLLL